MMYLNFIRLNFFFFRDQNMLQRIVQCCTLNGGIFCLSIVIFEYVILPALDYIMSVAFGNLNENIWLWTRSLLSWTFGAVWVLPIFLLSKIINSLWFQVIYNFLIGFTYSLYIKLTYK